MPDYFSHAICAQKILENCNKKTRTAVCNEALFYLGAQGGDVFFTYKLNFGASNLGKKLHSVSAAKLFNVLVGGDKSYACGFATHYAIDSLLHPTVNAFAASKKSPLVHMRFEADLGLYISRKYSITRRILPHERVLNATFGVYDSMVKFEPQITLSGVERCLKRHFAISRELLKRKRTKYGCDYDFASLSGLIDDAVSFGTDCVESVAVGKIDEELFSLPFGKEEPPNTLS